mmetsp:Transcript_48513/g.49308  ORF Transcript_48513/g.49308 Transcript_48513/m.49308 type:complete len:80 (+) Transcript_48513:176-415(+)
MSDTASFVAAVLRDRTVVDLKEENDKFYRDHPSAINTANHRENRPPIYLEKSLTSIKMGKGTKKRKVVSEGTSQRSMSN